MPKPKISIEHPDFPHGSNAGYARGCKCADCRQAHSEDVKCNYLKNHPEPKRVYRKHGGDTTHSDFPHGEDAGYIAGCRCEKCRTAHREAFNAYSLIHRAPGTPGGMKKRAANLAYSKTAKGVASARKGNATRYARIWNALTLTTEDDRALVRHIYLQCPDGYEVDHIVPLSKGGAHVANNLQYLPMQINRQKNNKTDYDTAKHAITWQSILDSPSTIIPSREYGQAAGSASDPSGSRYDLVYQETDSSL